MKSCTTLLILTLVACADSKKKSSGLPTGTVTFKTGFPLTARHSGVFHDIQGKRDLVYFADAVTTKKLLLFTTSGNLVDSIPLGIAIDSLDEIAGLCVTDMDTVVLSSMYTNKLLIIDHSGKCSKSMDLSRALTRPNGLQYECWASPTTSFMINSSAYFDVALKGSSVPDALEHVNTPGNNAVSAYYHLAAIGPKSIRVDFLHDPAAITWALDSFYFKISPSTHAKPEMGEYECINDLFFVHSKYSSKIIALDPHSLKTVRSFLITTAGNTSTHLTGIELPATENPNIQDSVNIRLATGGYISAIQYDKPTGHYIVSLVHSVGPSQPLDERGVARRFSLLEYDGDFKMVREQVFPAKKYKMFFMLPLQTGTFIQRWEDKQTAMSGTHTFERLNIGVE